MEVAYFKFDETSGSTASDSSGSNNHGTLVADPTWQPCCGAVCSWSWKELHDQTGMSEDMSFILFTDCFPCTYSTYPDWLALGKPRCWCAPPAGTGYQCDGDADGGTETFFKYRIYGNDINLVVGNWKRKVDNPLLDPCADIDHKSETFFKYRVYGKDLATVVTNWKKIDRGKPYDPAKQLPGDCPRPE